MTTSGVQRVLEARLRDGAKARVLVPRGTTLRVKGADVRETDLTRALPMALADQAEVLLTFPGAGGSEHVTGVEEYGVWVTVAPSVQSLWASFEELWARSL